MGSKKPIMLYYLITLILIISSIYFGLVLKDLLSDKFSSKDVEKTNDAVKEELPDDVRQARAIFSIALLILIVLSIIFILNKMALRGRSF